MTARAAEGVLALGAAVRVVAADSAAGCSGDDEGVVIESGGDDGVVIEGIYLVQMRGRRVRCRAVDLIVAAP